MDEINPNLKPGFTFGGWLPEIIPEFAEIYKIPYERGGNSTQSEKFFMFQAFLAGMKNASISNPNPSVGCVIVKNNQIIASGCTHAWKGIHAEQDAFNKLQGQNIEGADVYVTLEPCTHFGNQPPCINLFSNLKINKIVIARADLNPVVALQGIGALKKMGINVNIGILAKEVTAWNYPFFIQQKLDRPLIALKWKENIAGSLAKSNSVQEEVSLQHTFHYVNWLRKKYDSLLMDSLTLLDEEHSLEGQYTQEIQGRPPLIIVFDPKAYIFFCSKDKQIILKKKYFTKNIKTLFLISENMIREVLSSSLKWCVELKTSAHVKILPVKREFDFYSAKDVLESLKNSELLQFFGRPLQSIFVEGGSSMLTLFIQDELFDVAHVFTNTLASISKLKRCEIISQAQFGSDTLIEITPGSRFHNVFY